MGGVLLTELASKEMLLTEGVACSSVLLALRSRLRLWSNSEGPALQLVPLYIAVMELLVTGMLWWRCRSPE